MIARLVALLIGTLALASLRGQFDTLPDPYAYLPLAGKLWFMAGFFTVLTNLAVAGLMFAVARGWRMPGVVAGGMLVAITMTGILYHLLLAHRLAFEGWAWWATQGLHTGVPLAVAGWWLAFGDKGVGWRQVPIWLIWPAIYCVYALGRGYVTGDWAYPFLNGDTLGAARLALNIAGLLAGFIACGGLVAVVARLVGKPVLVQ